MTKLLAARLVLMVIGIVVWGYGYRVENEQTRVAGMAVLAVALLLRLVPKRWVGEVPPETEEREDT